MIKFVNPLSLQRRNSVRMMNLRVKAFKEGQALNPESVFDQIVENWDEL